MDQKYIDTIRACKVLLNNLEHLEISVTVGQRAELERMMYRVVEGIHRFLEADDRDEGLWVGEE